jgi:hypothetical protein
MVESTKIQKISIQHLNNIYIKILIRMLTMFADCTAAGRYHAAVQGSEKETALS